MLPRLAVPQGDLGGIGPEVALATLARPEVRASCRPLLLGHLDALREVADAIGVEVPLQAVTDPAAGFAVEPGAPVPVLELESPRPLDAPGAPSAAFGMAAVEAVLRGGTMCVEGAADALVTPPLSKQSMRLAGYAFEGQTQIVGELGGTRRYGMLACNGPLRVLLATRHMSLRQALQRLEITLVEKHLRLAHETARELLGVEQPRIVLAGLNPHAGENGAFGNEERKVLAPAIRRVAEEHGWETAGPAVPDVVFAEGAAGAWDVVVALYHDQAFIPLKLLGRDTAYTITVGGGILRLSPMHGTAYDLARTGRASAAGFRFALERAVELCRAR
jgi:4-hydroxythreonine-4-phosphate dehydrogenase